MNGNEATDDCKREKEKKIILMESSHAQRHVTHLSADLLVRRAFPRGVRRQSEGKYSQDGISSREIYWPITPFLFHFRAKTFVHGSNHGKQISATLRIALTLFVLLSGQCK